MANFVHIEGKRAINLDLVDSFEKMDRGQHPKSQIFFTTVGDPDSFLTWEFETKEERDAVYDQLLAAYSVEIHAPTTDKNYKEG